MQQKKRSQLTKKQIALIDAILEWYRSHKRDLPWRRTMHPYRILVSEVMLQQTQVERVVPKYRSFLRAFPSATALAKAPTKAVITAWQGLGYNRRALFLQRTAQAVVTDYSRRFPRTLEQLRSLPGVGDYTARALLSFAFDESVPVMDTNHRKLYQRIFFRKELQPDAVLLVKAEQVVAFIAANKKYFEDGKSAVYHWNQAVMDFQSAVCRNMGDECTCPITRFCTTYPLEKKQKKSASVPFRQTDRYYRGRIVDVLREEHAIGKKALQKRFDDIPKTRLENIVRGLLLDGLIKEEKQSIILP